MENIRNLVAQGKLKEAIALITTVEGTLLSARLNSLLKEERHGLISYEDASREKARISHAILSFAPNSTHGTYVERATVVVAQDFNEATLLDIVKENKRRRPDVAKEAQDVLTSYRTWKDTKTTNPSYDPTGRRLNSIKQSAESLVARLAKEKGDSLEAVVEKIMSYIDEPIPSFDDLNEAFKLASGRGFRNTWIEQQLNVRPNDTEVNIDIAEKLEEFVASISVK